MSPTDMNAGIALFVFLAVGAVALFTFLSVATWAGTRQQEREAYYKAEMMKKIAEVGGERNPALDYLREQERIAAAKRLGGYKLGGLVVAGLGLGVLIFLKALLPGQAVYLCGTIFLFIGLALLAYATWFAPERAA
jgi:ferric-dicitrate binding protein FerR (iron transport regulator)